MDELPEFVEEKLILVYYGKSCCIGNKEKAREFAREQLIIFGESCNIEHLLWMKGDVSREDFLENIEEYTRLDPEVLRKKLY